MALIAVLFLLLIRWAWKRNGYIDREGLPEVRNVVFKAELE
jgi:hypothetical protein